MRKPIHVVMTAILVLALAIVAMAADPFNGVWILNLAKSQYPAMAPKSLTMTIRSNDAGFTQIMDGITADGKPFHDEWTGKADGKDYPEKSSNTMAIKRIDSNSVSSVAKQNGKETGSGGAVISKDGKILTMTIRDKTPDGKDVTIINIFDRR
jgi:hypothetical protein